MPKKLEPVLSTRGITDPVVLENFKKLERYFQGQNQLFGFEHIIVEADKAQDQIRVRHNLGYTPRDVIVTDQTGARVHFLHDKFDSEFIVASSEGKGRLRAFVGTFHGDDTRPEDIKGQEDLEASSESESNQVWAVSKIATVKYVQPVGTFPDQSGGTGAYFPRLLNTVEDPFGMKVKLAGTDGFSLPPGRYYVRSLTPGYRTNRSKSLIWNQTKGIVHSHGTTEHSGTPHSATNKSIAARAFEISQKTTFKIHQIIQGIGDGNREWGVEPTTGHLGADAGDGVFTIVEIYKFELIKT